MCNLFLTVVYRILFISIKTNAMSEEVRSIYTNLLKRKYLRYYYIYRFIMSLIVIDILSFFHLTTQVPRFI